jgi:hypothetical protein
VKKKSEKAAMMRSQERKMNSWGQKVAPKRTNLRAGRLNQIAGWPPQVSQGPE